MTPSSARTEKSSTSEPGNMADSCAQPKAYRVRTKPQSTTKPSAPSNEKAHQHQQPQTQTLTGHQQKAKNDPEDRGPHRDLAALEKRRGEALERLEWHEAQDDFTPEDRLLRLLPYLQALWRAEDALEDPADRAAGYMPYVRPYYKDDHPFYVAELDA